MADLIRAIELLKAQVKIAKIWVIYLTPKIIDNAEHWLREVNLVGHVNPRPGTPKGPTIQAWLHGNKRSPRLHMH